MARFVLFGIAVLGIYEAKAERFDTEAASNHPSSICHNCSLCLFDEAGNAVDPETHRLEQGKTAVFFHVNFVTESGFRCEHRKCQECPEVIQLQKHVLPTKIIPDLKSTPSKLSTTGSVELDRETQQQEVAKGWKEAQRKARKDHIIPEVVPSTGPPFTAFQYKEDRFKDLEGSVKHHREPPVPVSHTFRNTDVKQDPSEKKDAAKGKPFTAFEYTEDNFKHLEGRTAEAENELLAKRKIEEALRQQVAAARPAKMVKISTDKEQKQEELKKAKFRDLWGFLPSPLVKRDCAKIIMLDCKRCTTLAITTEAADYEVTKFDDWKWSDSVCASRAQILKCWVCNNFKLSDPDKLLSESAPSNSGSLNRVPSVADLSVLPATDVPLTLSMHHESPIFSALSSAHAPGEIDKEDDEIDIEDDDLNMAPKPVETWLSDDEEEENDEDDPFEGDEEADRSISVSSSSSNRDEDDEEEEEENKLTPIDLVSPPKSPTASVRIAEGPATVIGQTNAGSLKGSSSGGEGAGNGLRIKTQVLDSATEVEDLTQVMLCGKEDHPMRQLCYLDKGTTWTPGSVYCLNNRLHIKPKQKKAFVFNKPMKVSYVHQVGCTVPTK